MFSYLFKKNIAMQTIKKYYYIIILLCFYHTVIL